MLKKQNAPTGKITFLFLFPWESFSKLWKQFYEYIS